jgi:hypothetical protein
MNGKNGAAAHGRHRISKFETGNLVLKNWSPYREQVLDFLQERDAPPGDYFVRISRRVRSSLPPGEVRLRPYQRNAIVVLLRPDGMDNGGIYEALIIGEFKDWSARDIHLHFERFDLASIAPQEEPVTIEIAIPEQPPVPEPPKLSLSEKLARLESIASRAHTRKEKITEIDAVIAAKTAEMNALKDEIASLEKQQYTIVEEDAADVECQNATEDLKALERLLGQ